MVRRCNLAEMEEDGVASLYMWDLCEIVDSLFLAAPPRPYMGGRDLGIRSKSVTGVCEP
jgi:hypothetical protein